ADLKKFSPLPHERTVADAVFRLNGGRIPLSQELLATSIRSILLPSAMHNGIKSLGLSTLADLLATNLDKLQSTEGIGPANLGFFLAHIFDYIFVLHEQETNGGAFDPDYHEISSGFHPASPTDSLLSSWLSEEMIKEGNALLKNDQPEVFLFYRNTAGAIMQDDDESGLVYLAMGNGQADHQHFTISTAACDLCTPKARHHSRQCRHIAALAIKIMAPLDNNAQVTLPLPFSFQNSPWLLIGRILFELFGQGGAADATIERVDKRWQLTIPGTGSRPWATWLLDEETAAFTSLFYSDRFQWLDTPQPIERAQQALGLRERLLDMGRTTAEVELNAFGKRSATQDRDESVWPWLASQSYGELPPKSLKLEGPDTEGLFRIAATHPATGRQLFTMTIPRAKTPDLVDCLDPYGEEPLILPPAKASTRIELGQDGRLTATSILKLPDGRTFDRHFLEEQLYGRYYHLPGEGFLPVTEQNPDHALVDPNVQPAVYHANKVPELLKKHRQAITAAENEIDPNLLALDFTDTPDRLEVDFFNKDENWCYLSGKYGLGAHNISLVELLTARMEKNRFMTKGEKWLNLTNSPLEWFHNLGEERLWHDEQTGDQGVRLTRREMMMLSSLVPDLKVDKTTRGRDLLDQLLDTEKWVERDHLDGLPDHLRYYQKHGIAWLNQVYHNRLSAILADDMGLGKTHQALGLLQVILTGNSKAKFLIVCPATVVPHWEEKINNFFPGLSYYVYHGSRRDLDKASTKNIYITTYGIIRRDTELLAELDFELIIFDEIQYVKNKKTDVYKAAARLKSEVIIGLTGTPLENSVNDLKAIFDICLPGYLGSDRDFKTRHADAIESSREKEPREKLARLINPFLLRRTREQVLTELPDVIEDYRTCELSEDQVGLYRDLISGRAQNLLNRTDPDQDDKAVSYMELLAVINYLKQICDHPCLVKKCTDPNRYRSGKWDLFVELLNECMAASMKVVVFSHYTTMLDLIEHYLAEQDIPFCSLRGDMPINKRHEMINRFNNDDKYRVFSASLLAGGIGVDLTAAQAVIHYDRWWNAAREDQATARVHRMGQKNVVQVFKLITVGTLEEKINKMIAKKKKLSTQLVREDDAAIIKKLSREELVDLIS
ncbi:MAG: DEAD/DEAH box helicase, partial [Thermodesulfobacteriota bacterium]